MDGPRLGPLRKFFTIDLAERINLKAAMRKPLSGYIGGVNSAGYWVTKLQNDWCETFGCKHAVACNSATSGLLAACMAIGIGPGDTVWTTAYSMSATAACAKVLGARIVFIDIETTRFSINMNQLRGPIPKCIIVTNLFGHPAYLESMRTWCDSNRVWMIEDNAQAPFAKENGRYAGTIGHMGVFSLNVHKHIQAGEGGIVVSGSEDNHQAVADAINHGELATGKIKAGLNLRMTEPIAAIACAQLARGKKIISDRRSLANAITEIFKGISWLVPPKEDEGCEHVYYVWAGRVENGKRKQFVELLNSRGFPMREGYSTPLPFIFDRDQECPTTNRIELHELITFEVCAYDPTHKNLRTMHDIARWAADEVQQ